MKGILRCIGIVYDCRQTLCGRVTPYVRNITGHTLAAERHCLGTGTSCASVPDDQTAGGYSNGGTRFCEEYRIGGGAVCPVQCIGWPIAMCCSRKDNCAYAQKVRQCGSDCPWEERIIRMFYLSSADLLYPHKQQSSHLELP